MKRILLFGGSFNPFGKHHEILIRFLSKLFDLIIVIPCGYRHDKESTNGIHPIHRATMLDIACRDLDNVRVDLFDLENDSFTKTHDLDRIFKEKLFLEFGTEFELFHAVGTDIIVGGFEKESYIHKVWENSEWVWENLNFAVVGRLDYQIDKNDLPPKSEYYEIDLQGSSHEIRSAMFDYKSITGLVDKEVEEYMLRHSIYRSNFSRSVCKLTLKDCRIMIPEPHPAHKKEAEKITKILEPYIDNENPNLIVPLGGDGMMLKSIKMPWKGKELWRSRIPFFGMNLGHVGFLMNNVKDTVQNWFPPLELDLWQLPLIYVEWEDEDGNLYDSLGFNEVFLKSSTYSSTWMRVLKNGQEVIPKLEGDGMMFVSAQGSTAHAWNHQATPVPVGTPLNLLVGIGTKRDFNTASLSLRDEITIESLDPKYRPFHLVIDARDPLINGKKYTKNIVRAKFRTSRTAAVELAFLPGHDPVQKLSDLQFKK